MITSPRNSQRATARGMTLVEILITMGIVSSVLLVLAILFGESASTVQKSKADSVSIFIAENVRARLLTDPEWPSGSTGQSFSRDVDDQGMPTDTFVFDALYFDDEGLEIESKDFAAYQCVLTFSRSPNYGSRRLDFIVLEVNPLPIGESITFSFQRANTTPRPESS